jgi:hypothetical protein
MEPEQHHENPETSAENHAGSEGQSTLTPNAEPEMSSPAPEATKQSSFGPVIGIIVIVILIVLAGFYFWGSSLKQQAGMPTDENQQMMEDNAAGTRPAGAPDAGTFDDTSASGGELPVSESDEVADLEAELDSTDLDNLDTELQDIDTEFAI